MKTVKIPFPFEKEAAAFMASFMEEVRAKDEKLRSPYVDPKNVLAYRHGHAWQPHNSSDPDSICTMREHAYAWEMPLKDIIDNDLDLLDRKVCELVNAMHEKFVTSIFETASSACKKSGNTVKLNISPADQFIEALRTIEFCVDREGKPSRPTLHMGETAFAAMIKDVKSKGPAFEAEVARLSQQKMAAALQKEELRRARFVKTDV